MDSNSFDTPRHQKLFTCALNNKVMWRPIQPMLNNYMWTSGPYPRGCQTIWIRHEYFISGHFDAVGCQSYYCQFKHMYILWYMYIYVDAVGVKTITVYLKCIFYGKYKHDKLLVPLGCQNYYFPSKIHT